MIMRKHQCWGVGTGTSRSREGVPRARSPCRREVKALASLPDFFAWPVPCPLRGDDGKARRRPFRRLDLDQVGNLEAVGPQNPNPVAVAEVEVDRAIRPVEPMQTEVGTFQVLARRGV